MLIGSLQRKRAVFVGALAALALLAASCGGSKVQAAADGGMTTASSGSTVADARGSSTPKRASGPSKLVDEWAACERSHGDIKQADPTIDPHGVINITTPRPKLGRPGAGRLPAQRLVVVGDPHSASGTCGEYLSRAQAELRAADPVRDPNGVDNATYLKYVACMRANGVPNYPSPEANDPSKTDFIGSGVNPDSPHVLKVNDLCGKKLGLPTWWIKGWGMPGDISVKTAGLHGGPPACAYRKHGCPTLVPAPGV